jgi:hypothetical protein
MPEDARAAIERFLEQARQPALLEPGEELLPLVGGNYALEQRGARLTLQAWDRTRNMVRRVTGVAEHTTARLELRIERFARREGRLFLLDLARPAGSEMGRKSGRRVFRERFRLFLRRQFPEWELADLSAEADLEHSLSPAYARGMLTSGQHAWAALAAPPEQDAAGALTFALIWLDYLRRRERRRTVEGLALYVPAGRERAVALRLRWMNPAAARFELFAYTPEDFVARAEPADIGNLDTRLAVCRRPAGEVPGWEDLSAVEGIERIDGHDGVARLRVRGLEFAEMRDGGVRFGLRERVTLGAHNRREMARLAEELSRVRSASAAQREHALYRQQPEAWLEAQARAAIRTLDASLMPAPLYGQVPAMAGGERGVIDLLAAAVDGRLVVIELKATADPHLPLQALDYWMRVAWHAEKGEFSERGYFPGVELRRESPKLLLVAPALEFHPSTETVLGFFSPAVPVERAGVGVEWRKRIEVVLRLSGAARPQ